MTERIEDVLRRAMADEAARAAVAPDALDRIRRRVAARRVRRWLPASPRGGVMIAIGSGATTALAATVIAVMFGTGACLPPTNNRPAPSGPPAATTPAPTSQTPSPGPDGAPAPGGSSTGPGSSAPTVQANLPVYYVGNTGLGPRLYREFHQASVAGTSPAARVRAALAVMLGGTAYDPDYRTFWPATVRIRSVSYAGGVATVDITGVGGPSLSSTASQMALAQLVWTATAASGGTGVRLLVNGAANTSLWELALTGTVLRRGPAVDVLAPIWLIDPQQGAVTGRTVTVRVAGFVFEAQGNLRVLDSAGHVQREYALRFSRGAPAQGEATLTLTLAPGTYTITAYDVSLKDGSEIYPDDHVFTVR